MTRHRHDDGELVSRHVDYDYVVHHEDGDPGLLVVQGVPASACLACDEYWFDEAVGFALSKLLQEHSPGSGEVLTISWAKADAA
jgi:hypothetical protein